MNIIRLEYATKDSSLICIISFILSCKNPYTTYYLVSHVFLQKIIIILKICYLIKLFSQPHIILMNHICHQHPASLQEFIVILKSHLVYIIRNTIFRKIRFQ